ncbi:MAG: T9SS type A sorting domain-containing protein, partial [Cryomorphaceae bacterium]
EALTTPSQLMNQSYGYLWWLNGQSNHMLPLDPNVYEGSMIPSGPDDMYMALGANDQKIYVVPSQGLVVTRQGDAAFGLEAAASAFDVELWELISNLECSPLSALDKPEPEEPLIFPNPSNGSITLPSDETINWIAVYSVDGRLIDEPRPGENLSLPKGIYLFSVLYSDQSSRNQKVIVQ